MQLHRSQGVRSCLNAESSQPCPFPGLPELMGEFAFTVGHSLLMMLYTQVSRSVPLRRDTIYPDADLPRTTRAVPGRRAGGQRRSDRGVRCAAGVHPVILANRRNANDFARDKWVPCCFPNRRPGWAPDCVGVLRDGRRFDRSHHTGCHHSNRRKNEVPFKEEESRISGAHERHTRS